jgi:hypothetical protein
MRDDLIVQTVTKNISNGLVNDEIDILGQGGYLFIQECPLSANAKIRFNSNYGSPIAIERNVTIRADGVKKVFLTCDAVENEKIVILQSKNDKRFEYIPALKLNNKVDIGTVDEIKSFSPEAELNVKSESIVQYFSDDAINQLKQILGGGTTENKKSKEMLYTVTGKNNGKLQQESVLFTCNHDIVFTYDYMNNNNIEFEYDIYLSQYDNSGGYMKVVVNDVIVKYIDNNIPNGHINLKFVNDDYKKIQIIGLLANESGSINWYTQAIKYTNDLIMYSFYVPMLPYNLLESSSQRYDALTTVRNPKKACKVMLVFNIKTDGSEGYQVLMYELPVVVKYIEDVYPIYTTDLALSFIYIGDVNSSKNIKNRIIVEYNLSYNLLDIQTILENNNYPEVTYANIESIQIKVYYKNEDE